MDKILIVDDHIGNIRILAEMLKEKYNVLAANCGAKALQLAEENMPSLILLDVMMPDLNGFETCEKLKNNFITEDIPVIFITAKNEPDDIIKGFNVGGCDYITKPFNPDELFMRIGTHIELKKSRELLKNYIEELEKTNDELDKMSKTDYLTGLANRRFMMERLKEESARSNKTSSSMGILMCDIDHFKKINDNFGHDFGDQVIKEIAKSINKELREYDIISRWGGEEFLVVLPETTEENAFSVAENIRKAVETLRIPSDRINHRVTITLGLAIYNSEKSISDNINNADEALYLGKDSGRNISILYKKALD